VKVLLTIDDVIEFDLLLLLKFFISAVPLSELQQFWIEWEKTQTQSQTQSQQNEDTIQKKKTRKRNKYQKHETTTTTTTTTTNEMRDDIVTPELALDRFLYRFFTFSHMHSFFLFFFLNCMNDLKLVIDEMF
jgi:hypothetical protein